MTLEEFDSYLTQLQQHDWFYDYSDDHSVWKRGEDSFKNLSKQAANDPVKYEMFKIYCSCHIDPESLNEAISELRSKVVIPA